MSKVSKETVEELKRIVGEQWVSTDPEVCCNSSRDMTEQAAPCIVDAVVLPDTVEHVQKIVQLANKQRFSIIPYACGANVGGLTLPHSEGTITIDFKRMRRVIKIDKQNKYIVVEPGFTFGHLRHLFDTDLSEFRYSFPFSPPWTSVCTNALLNGLGSLSVLYGSADNFINGLEVVLPTGELVQIGNHAINGGEFWYGRAPLPDLTGIFVATQGIMGIVTKISIQLIDRPKYMRNIALLPTKTYQFFKTWVHDLDRLHLCDEIGIGYFPAKVARGLIPNHLIELMANLAAFLRKGNTVRWMKKVWPLLKAITANNPIPFVQKLVNWHLLPLPKAGENDPILIVGLTVGAEVKEVFEAKIKAIKKFVKDKDCLMIFPEEFGELEKVFASILDLPAQLPAFYDLQRGGGLTWVGSYVPITQVADGLMAGSKVLSDRGFFPIGVLRPMKGDHYFVLRFIIPFNKSSNEEINKVRDAIEHVADVILDIGGVPYKMSPPIARKIWTRGDKNFYELIAKIKDLLDPNAILNPGKLLVFGTPNHPYTLPDLYQGRGFSEPLPYRPIKHTDESEQWNEQEWLEYRQKYSLENLKQREVGK
jgi:FAD/FMN-containing dehydrogenase